MRETREEKKHETNAGHKKKKKKKSGCQFETAVSLKCNFLFCNDIGASEQVRINPAWSYLQDISCILQHLRAL